VNVEIILSDDQVREIAHVAAELAAAKLAAGNTRGGLVDAATLAHELGVSRDTVYAHADELGGRRVGDGDRPRLRFNLADALAAWQPSTAETPTRTAPRRRRSSNGRSNLLPVIER
jgi:hypothetical protein